ncbi:hypothetical protein P4H65_26560 [Paenibacillus chitinolyticus]|uniref:RipA family octameric membrane protein n=1 Tax=Paenibacillus chitinolyticus TaxID=79263 RepID=UPI002DBBB4E1|nr:hypothetical protein [Paenibacillus chitinolyticus]MEC0249347.1 hypothetical protein [Paenibacillus chitinolyticus]
MSNREFRNREDYLNEFKAENVSANKEPSESRQSLALKMALDIRKFEIDMYWKRATYFWTFIGATFAGYFLLINGNVGTAGRLYWGHILIVSVLGFLFSFSWFLVNRGSKFWQNNWERHVDFLEDEIMGPLYKTVTNPKNSKFLNPLSEYPLSVSKINQILSLFITVIWLFLLYESIHNAYDFHPATIVLIEIGFVVIITLFFYLSCRSKLVEKDFGEQGASFVKRKMYNEKNSNEGEI